MTGIGPGPLMMWHAGVNGVAHSMLETVAAGDLGGWTARIVILTVVVAVIVFLVWDWVSLGPRDTYEASSVPLTPDETLQELSGDIAGFKGVTINVGAPGSVVVSVRRLPALAVFLAVALFPIGLLALFIRQRGTLVIACTQDDEDGGTVVTLKGRTTRGVNKYLKQALDL